MWKLPNHISGIHPPVFVGIGRLLLPFPAGAVLNTRRELTPRLLQVGLQVVKLVFDALQLQFDMPRSKSEPLSDDRARLGAVTRAKPCCNGQRACQSGGGSKDDVSTALHCVPVDGE